MARDKGGGKETGRLKRKQSDKELMAKLHVELVKLQEWVIR